MGSFEKRRPIRDRALTIRLSTCREKDNWVVKVKPKYLKDLTISISFPAYVKDDLGQRPRWKTMLLVFAVLTSSLFKRQY